MVTGVTNAVPCDPRNIRGLVGNNLARGCWSEDKTNNGGQIWRDDNHAILVEGSRFKERLDYIHRNPVEQLIVANENDYLFSSAYEYSGKKGLVKVTIG